MANELSYIDHSTTGQTVYYAVLTSGANCINASTGASQSLTSGNWQSAAIVLSDSTHAGHYLASVPPNTAAGRYVWKVYQSSGTPSSTAAIGDAEISGSDSVNWSGTAEVVLSTISANDAAIKAKTDLIATNAADSPNAVTAQTAIAALPMAADNATATWAAGTRTLTALPSPAPTGYGGGASAVGPGADSVTITIDVDGDPVIDAAVWITNDAEGQDVEAGTLRTNAQGKATFLLDAGSAYYLWMKADRINPIVGEAFVAVADA